MGLIYDEVRRIVKSGATCRCPCRSGVATVTSTDVLVVGPTSNWGSYGIEVMFALLNSNEKLLHTPALEANMLSACVVGGGRDGPLGKQILSVDGNGLGIQRNVVDSLNILILAAIKS
jgi:hypothetical protein